MKNIFKVLAIMATIGMSAVAMAKDPTTKPAGLRGKVQSIDGMVITIKNKTGEVTIETDANTTFTLDDKPATLADVKAGERVVSASPTTGVASEVKLMSGGGHKKKDKAPTTAPTAN